MKISKKIIINSIENLKESTTNKFWGLLAIFSSVNNEKEKIDTNSTYKVETHLISKKLEDLFYFGTDAKGFGEHFLYFHLSKNWKELFNDIVLNSKPNIHDVAVFFFKNEEFERLNSTEIVNKFINIINLPTDVIEIIFDLNYIDYDIPLERSYVKNDLFELIKQNFNLQSNHSTFSFESPYSIASHPGELKRASFTQTLYSGSKIQEIILITDFNLDEYYFISNKNIGKNESNRISHKNKNIIYYGSPGTGKSHKVNEILEPLDAVLFERVTFHPEFDNTSFVGGYKPISATDAAGNDVIKYKFIPQAFTNIYQRAWKDLDNQYYLVIEEINRGNCAEIFGEIFQLLDRNSNYTVSPSLELKDYLIKDAFKDANHDGIKYGLRLPSNLTILATMNTSDQSLFPMDSAFKRRWDWEYIPICYNPKDDFGKKNESFDFEIDIEDGNRYSWIKFIETVNLNHIKNNPSLGMDKCIGNYFIKPDAGKTISLKPFINKVVFYLWNDVFKDEDNKVFEENTSYEDFFPTQTNGKRKIKELFNRIGINPITKYQAEENESPLAVAAEPEAQTES